MSYCGSNLSYDCPHCGDKEEFGPGVWVKNGHVCRVCGHTAEEEHVMDQFGFCRRCKGQHPFVCDSAAHLAHPQRPKWKAVTNLIVPSKHRRTDSRMVMSTTECVAEVDIQRHPTVGIDMFSNEQ